MKKLFLVGKIIVIAVSSSASFDFYVNTKGPFTNVVLLFYTFIPKTYLLYYNISKLVHASTIFPSVLTPINSPYCLRCQPTSWCYNFPAKKIGELLSWLHHSLSKKFLSPFLVSPKCEDFVENENDFNLYNSGFDQANQFEMVN